MTKIFRYAVFTMVMLPGIISCTKDLELTPVSQISNASFWKTEDDATAALNGMYVGLRLLASSDLFYMGESRSETMGKSIGEPGQTTRYVNNILSAVNITINWKNVYTVVHEANLILKYVPDIGFTSDDKKNAILAQAHAMRAYLYFTLVRTWGNIPLVDIPTETADPSVNFRPQATQEAIFELVKKDMDEAITLFPSTAFPIGRNMWSKPAVQALKADVYLWTAKKLNGGAADFTAALTAGTEAKNSDVELLANFDNIFRYTNKGNNEILMAVRFMENESAQNDYANMYIFPAYLPTNIPQPTKDAIGLAGGTSLWTASEIVRNQFTSDDQRRDGSFREIYTYPAGDPSGPLTYYNSVVYKFRGIELNGQRLFLDDYILYRYADVLLMIAEAKNGLGQDPSDEINQVRQRAYGANYPSHVYTNGTTATNDDAILKERLLELSFEGKRWWDLVRFNKAFELVPSLQASVGHDELLLFPISETTLGLNPSLKQNPGY